MASAPPRRMIVLGLITLLLILKLYVLATAHFNGASESTLGINVGDKVQESLFPAGNSSVEKTEPEYHGKAKPEPDAIPPPYHGKAEPEPDAIPPPYHGKLKAEPHAIPPPDHGKAEPEPDAIPPPYHGKLKAEQHAIPPPDHRKAKPGPDTIPPPYDSEKGSGGVGKHFHVRPSAPTPKSAAIEGCQYPIVIHVTPDEHCTGALTLYASIVRNVLKQPEELQGKTCVHVTYVDPKLTSIEEMYQWKARPNPFKAHKDCAALDSTPALNDVVPLRFQALRGIEKPDFMQVHIHSWLVALNKVNSWAFDAYPRILLMDGDSIAITDLHLIFDESNPWDTVTAAPDQFANCGDVSRINGGMVLLRGSRYFHMSALEMVYDPESSCMSHKWEQSEQELLNCLCGTQGPPNGLRPEFVCAIMPLYNTLWPPNFACSTANIRPIRSVHFTATTKPWAVDDQRLPERADYAFWGCVRDAARAGDADALVDCDFPGLEVSRAINTQKPPPPKNG